MRSYYYVREPKLVFLYTSFYMTHSDILLYNNYYNIVTFAALALQDHARIL